MEVLEDRTVPSISDSASLPLVSVASPPAAPQVATIPSLLVSMMEQKVQLLATLEQDVSNFLNAESQAISQAVSAFEQRLGSIFGISPNPTASSSTSSDSGSGRGNASGSGSGGGAQTANNAPNQTLNNSTQPSGHGSGGGSSATTNQMPTGPAGMKAQPLDGGGSGSLFNGSGPGSGVTGSGTGSGPASVSGQVWLDNNGNGNLDNGETGYQGITVNLLHFDADGSVDGEFSTTTDGSGDYQFNLELGPDAQTYAIQVVLGSATIPVVATIPGFSQIGPHGMSQKFQLANGGERFVEGGIRSMQATTTQDDPGGAIHMQVTLRDAIQTGNNLGGKFVTFADQAGDAMTGTITLQAALDPIEQSYNIVGPGSSMLAISGANSFGVFTVDAGVTSTISGLTIEEGSNGNGGGVFNSGNLTLNSDVIKGNQTTGNGGGIDNDAGSLTLSGDQILGNSATGAGGGLYNAGGMVTITGGMVFKTNKAQGGQGGGICNASGTVTLSGGTVINSNATSASGGGVANSGTFLMTGGQISQNYMLAGGNAGGGVYNVGTLRLLGVQVQGNSAVKGGGIYTKGRLVLGNNTTISGNNRASSYGAGIYVYGGTAALVGGGVTNNTAQKSGGGIYVQSGELSLSGVLVSGNTAVGGNLGGNGGGIFILGGKVTMSGGTIGGNNTAGNNGGGIYNLGGTLTLRQIAQQSVVITDNRANNQGGGMYLASLSTTTFDDALVSGNRTNGGQNATGWGVYLQNGADVNGWPGDGLTDEDDPFGNPVQGP